MTTKAIWKDQLTKAGIELPDNWAKMSTSRAKAFTETAMQKAPSMGFAAGIKRGVMSLAGAALAAGSAVTGLAHSTAAHLIPAQHDPDEIWLKHPQAKDATMPKNPNWGRSERKYRKHSFYPSNPAPDPVPLTRQVRRQNERRAVKMPLGVSTSKWHALMGYGRIGSGKGYKGAAA